MSAKDVGSTHAHVNSNRQQHRLSEHDAEGTGDDVLKALGEGDLVRLDQSVVPVVASFLPQTLSLPLEDDGRVRLGQRALEHGHDAREDHLHPEHPAPADTLADEATDDRPQDRATVWRRREERNGKAALLVVPDVRDRAAGERQRCRREDAAEETADEECLDVFGESAGDDED